MGASNDNFLEKVNLMKGIKSKYIMQIIFSFLQDKKKLNLISYNKKYMNILDINLEYIKKVYGKYEIIGNDGKGKEYKLNTDILLFEGEYSNGKKNGEGKEFYESGKLKYEGGYINGKRDGIGKEYYESGRLKYKRNNVKEIGEEYFENGRIKYKGEYLNQKRNGKGTEYNEHGIIMYEGQL